MIIKLTLDLSQAKKSYFNSITIKATFIIVLIWSVSNNVMSIKNIGGVI